LLSGGFTPRALSGCVAWLDASRESAFADAAAVGTWTDWSGRGNHATQGAAGNKPIYKPGIINGRPVVRFDGTDDWLTFASALLPANALMSVFMVMKPTSEAVRGTFLSQYAGGQPGRLDWIANSNDAGVATAGRILLDVNGTTSGAGAGGLLADFAYSGTIILSVVNAGIAESYRGYVNGVLQDSATLAAVYAAGNTAIGSLSPSAASLPFDGDIAELIIYSRALVTGEQKRVERYLGRKYGLVLP
jgi:hypothetical protein